ncbi:hypothetical protein IW140_005155 [Coemansia sp. RSA 1813]|nr:hypothetical protein EV178_005132 [Coemansia sp. RSA 1646]KAJ1768108.1 hypothetical protein LPJ74_005007 [Coemansia sp. RSA 1843]KAJ2088035.1 hypothetical protein IW138_004543 [Coemansia sp. RSA 986]KAJ2211947.1 hypothetical protein EV179_005054 [Coemansia sp. RSA 487]KAJ2565873.1 hypothetical protein IW140_005155 [Coemansia sp. RSA 1813]
MSNTFTYVKDSILFSKKTHIYLGQMESSSQTSNIDPVWTIHAHDREITICTGRNGHVVMSAIMEGVNKNLAQFNYQGKVTNGGFDGTKSTWAFVDFDGKRYDWVASMMQNCWKLEDSEGKVVAQYIGMSRDMRVKGTLALQAKVSETLIGLIHLSSKMLKYSETSRR